MQREHITDGLDVLGLLLLAAGVAAAAERWLDWGWASLGAAGVVVIAGSQLAGYLAARAARPARPARAAAQVSPAGAGWWAARRAWVLQLLRGKAASA